MSEERIWGWPPTPGRPIALPRSNRPGFRWSLRFPSVWNPAGRSTIFGRR
jgi:hypothetical protein